MDLRQRRIWIAALAAMVCCCITPTRADDDAPAASASSLMPSWMKWKEKFGLQLDPWAYVRMGYESVDNDDRYDFIGRNDGFILDNARIGFDASVGEQLSVAFSLEGASDIEVDTNTPMGELDVRVRDAYVRYDPLRYFGIQGGQFKAPFAAEELRSRADLSFVSRAVGQEGVLPGRGFEEPGVQIDRQLGVMISSGQSLPIWNEITADYYAMLANGNGDNELLNDNDDLAVIGRIEAHYEDLVTIGAAVLWNKRTAGDPPNQSDDEDTGVATDLLLTPYDGEIFFQYVELDTDYKTVSDTLDRTQRAFHVQVSYLFEIPWMTLTPGYRYAVLDPYADADGDDAGLDLDAFEVDYHTIGVRIGHLELPLSLFVNYTFTEEKEPRELDNDRLQILTQVVF